MLTTAQYSNIIPELWSKDFYDELRPQLGIAALVENRYEGLIKSWGDTVKVQTFETPGRAQILNSDNEAYSVQVPVVSNQDLVIDKSSVWATEVTDWAKYQSNPRQQEEIRKMGAHEVARSVDEKIIATIAAGSSQSGITAMTKALFAQAGRVLDVANVPNDGSRIALCDPYYYEDLVGVNELLSRDYIPSSSVLMSGQVRDPIYGFKLHVSNLLPQNNCYFFHKSFMQVAVQKGAEYKEMDLEASTNVPSMRVRIKNLFGLKQFDGNRCYRIYNS